MARISGSSVRPRARLISTPSTTYPDYEGASMTTTIEGVRFSDQLGALLDHAQANGFRLERKAKTLTLIAYPPDGESRPITVQERGAKFNRPHYENIRRDFYRSGCPPLPADQPTADTAPTSEEDTAMPKIKYIKNEAQLSAALAGEDQPEALGAIVDGLFERAGLEAFGGLAGGLAYAVATFARDAQDSLASAAKERATADLQAEVEAALSMASAAEEKATRLEAALEAATAREAKARKDCGEALERARVAEAKYAEQEAVLAPLRALLGK